MEHKEIRVCVVDMEEKIINISKASDEGLLHYCEKTGNVYSLTGFSTAINDGDLDVTNKFIKFVSVGSYEIDTNKRFPNGFASWYETFYIVVEYLSKTKDEPYSPAQRRNAEQGRGGLYEMAAEMTNAFEFSHINSIWEGDFYEEIDRWLDSNATLFSPMVIIIK